MTHIDELELWINPIELKEGENVKLRFNSLELFVSHQIKDWQMAFQYTKESENDKEKASVLSNYNKLPKSNLTNLRVIRNSEYGEHNKKNKNKIQFQPRLADRNIVAKPHSPFHLLPNEKVTLFISTPVWLSMQLGGTKYFVLDIPSYQLSDTWFGPKPHIGELCYSSKFSGRTNFESLPKRRGRITTAVTVLNNSNSTFKLDKISLPTAYLSVYLAPDGMLWSSDLEIVCQQQSRTSPISISKELPKRIANASLVIEPRNRDTSDLVKKTIDWFFN